MRNILILYDSRYSDIIRNYISLNPEDIYYGIFVNNNLYKNEDNKIINFLDANDYLNFEDLSNIDRESINIAKSWYIKSCYDISTFKGISIGRVVEYDIMKIICQNLKSFVLLEKIIEKEKIETILISGDNRYFEKSAEIIAKNNNITIENFCENEYKKTRHINIKSRIKKYISNHSNYIYSISNIGKNDNAEILFVYSKRSEYLINKLSKHYRISLVVLDHIINPKILIKRNITVIQLKPYNLSENEDEWIKGLVQNFESYLISSFDKKFIELLLLTDIKSYLKSIFNFYLKYIPTISKQLSDKKYNLVIVGQDFLGIPRLIVECANKLNIKTFVLQHGAYGFYPYFVSPISKYVGIWGKKWGDWLKKIGVDDSRFIITGEPYYDKYFKIKNKNKNPIKNILIPFTNNVTISSFGEFSKCELNIIRILNALSHFDQEINIILKMRTKNEYSKGLDLVRKSQANNVKVIGKTNNYKLLSKVDIIVTNGSTIAFEGFLLNKLVLIENFECVRHKDRNPYSFSNATFEFNSEKELITLINDIINDKQLVDILSENVQKFLEHYFITGNSFECTRKAIHNLVR